MHNGFAICLAWPKTRCKQAGSWYDPLMRLFKINKLGYYKVGHAAVVLINAKTQKCFYFDFGRYHSPHGKGRVRSEKTDHDLSIKTIAAIDPEKQMINNIDDILLEIAGNKSCHGHGELFASVSRIDYYKSFSFARLMQEKEFIIYGPFVNNGTNCSKFVNQVILKGNPSLLKRILLKYPAMLSPTPFWNVLVTGNILKIIRIKSMSEKIICKDSLKHEYAKSCITSRA